MIEGCVSGTLMYVVSAVSAGKPFSQAVREAVDKGYAEPDPRDDLSGADAARKALILARLMGYRGAGPTPDDLVPKSLRKLPLDAFMARLSEVDDEWRTQGRARGSAQPRPALRRLGVAARRLRPADRGRRLEPDRRAAGHAQPDLVHDEALLEGTARRQRPRRRRRGHGGRNSQRHLLVGYALGLGTRGSGSGSGLGSAIGLLMNTQLTPDALLRLILTSRVYDVAQETPLEPARHLSQRLGNEILLKREDLQPVFSYKLRGAYNRIAHLSEAERRRGVIAASAGNHAQGVAYAARHLGLRALIVMPQTTPEIKVDAVRELGAEVVLFGDTYTDAKARCDELVVSTGLTFIDPFDDPLVIAGQGTIANEILRHKLGDVSAIFVPVGGGGLIAGIASYVKAVRPDVRVIGVEPFEADAMFQSVAAGKRVALDRVGIFADGVAVREVGALTFPIVLSSVERIVRVSNDAICAAIKDVFDDTRSIMEPAGALAVAGLRAWVEETGTKDARLVAILSGANMNFDRLRFVAERAEVGEAREAILGVTIPERAGAFREFCATIGRRVVTEFNYRLSSRDRAHIFVGVATQSREDARDLAATLDRRRLRNARAHRQRSGEAARPPHGRRPQPRGRQRTGVPVRVP